MRSPHSSAVSLLLRPNDGTAHHLPLRSAGRSDGTGDRQTRPNVLYWLSLGLDGKRKRPVVCDGPQPGDSSPVVVIGWMTGFEPATTGSTDRRSAVELHPPCLQPKYSTREGKTQATPGQLSTQSRCTQKKMDFFTLLASTFGSSTYATMWSVG